MQPQPSPSAVVPASAKRVRLHFKCKGIADLDTFSKSDPYIVLYAVDTTNAAPAGNRPAPPRGSRYGREIGRTETIMNDLNPVFKRPVEAHFFFEARQVLNAVVYDFDGSTNDAANDVCGVANFQLSHIICSSQGKREFPLITPAGATKGSIEVSFSEISNVSARSTVRFGFRGCNLIPMGLLGSNSPFFTISRLQPNGTKLLVYQSEVCQSNSNPKWAISRPIQQGDLFGASRDEQTIVFDLFTKGSLGGDTGMGSHVCSLSSLESAHTSGTAFAPRKAKNPSKHYGDVFVDSLQVTQFPTFAQSLASGWQISMALSIDFTGSNGDPRSPHSLHFMNPAAPNQYVSAIMSVGDILMEYDTHKQIPVFGFGASFQGAASHFFNVNMRPDPYVNGIQGALNAYGAFLPTAILSGPTNFAPTIRAVALGARQAEAKRVYTILLIITDGEITDMAESIDALVEADDAPLSIVIVGVGFQCDFRMMDELDGDGVNLRARNGRVSRRDLVQFVPYRDFLPPKPREALAAEVLREIPDQFEEYLMLASQRTAAKQQFTTAMSTEKV